MGSVTILEFGGGNVFVFMWIFKHTEGFIYKHVRTGKFSHIWQSFVWTSSSVKNCSVLSHLLPPSPSWSRECPPEMLPNPKLGKLVRSAPRQTGLISDLAAILILT